MFKIFALVVVGLLSPMTVAADAVWFGNVNIAFDRTDTNGVKDYQFNDRGTRVGIKGAAYLNDIFETSYIVEVATALADGDELIGEVRQAWLGLRGDFGEVRVGRHLGPSRVALEPVDLFADQPADQNTVLESDALHEKSIAYINHTNNVGYALALSKDDSSNGLSADFLANYNTDHLYLAAAYLKGDDSRNTLRLGVAYRFPDGHRLGAAFENLDDRTGSSGHNAYVVNGGYRLGKALLKGQLGRNNPAAVGHTETLIGFGVDYDIWEAAVLRAQYSINAHRDHSDSDKERAFSVGISYRF